MAKGSGGDGSGDADAADTGGTPDGSGDTRVDRGLLGRFASCERVPIEGLDPAEGPWRIEGEPLIFGASADAPGGFRAPAVARETVLEVVSDRAQAFYRVEVTPRPQPEGQAPGLAADCAPFELGVASGDPTATSVLLWTQTGARGTAVVDPPGDGSGEGSGGSSAVARVGWEVSTDPYFTNLVASGEAEAPAWHDHTVTVEVTGLEPASTYFYRFVRDGETSRTGRTQTAPAGPVDRARFALASCSSLWSGYFNAYRRLAERTDIDLVIHVGDYIYDFVDEDERIRVPNPPIPDPTDVATHRARHAYYLLDPDLRAARAAHPWFVLWDNHDLIAGDRPAFGGGVRAFREYVPSRLTDAARPAVAWRTLRYGDLVDLSMLDVLLWRNLDLVEGTDEPSILGNEQFEWLRGELTRSTATWRLVGTQKLVSPVDVPIDIGGSTWLSFPASRRQLLRMLQAEQVDNVVILSGDAHMTFVADVIEDAASYDAQTGAGSRAVEFLAGSVSRGNVDESVDLDERFLGNLRNAFLALNPHMAHTNLVDHGYGVVDVTPERVVVEMWLSPILEPSSDERFERGVEVRAGSTNWSRSFRTVPTSPTSPD